MHLIRMRPLLTIAALLMSMYPTIPTRANTLLDSMRDRSRPLLLFGGLSDTRILQQYAELQRHAEGLEDRQMRIVLITTTGTPVIPPPPNGTVSATATEAAELRKKFHIVPNTFAVILVGKDGGEKFRSAQPVTFERLSGLVDSMPMRQQEMRVGTTALEKGAS